MKQSKKFSVEGWAFELYPTDRPYYLVTSPHGLKFQVHRRENSFVVSGVTPCCEEAMSLDPDSGLGYREGISQFICMRCKGQVPYSEAEVTWTARWDPGRPCPINIAKALESHCNPLEAVWEANTVAFLLEKLYTMHHSWMRSRITRMLYPTSWLQAGLAEVLNPTEEKEEVTNA